ncbi:hypothetical protein K502DRAFT_348599 [Neoconidiobolus thromboides FSU 785]|nr:hypothetical protein K502DRAFT_348599 [Neoconidiobolus thromboides FSU 785]
MNGATLIVLPLYFIAVGYGSNNFQTTFQWPGTIDFSCWLATDVSLDFIEKYGQDNIINYIHNLAWEGGQRVAKLIGGKVLGEEHQSGNMVNYFYLK